jgi:uncharacterized membrane protein YphA (DoxX/SURF4 family)
MKPRDIWGLAARVIVGAVLIYAGAAKTAVPAEEFANVILAYSVLPADMALPLAAFLPWIELLVGWALLLGVETKLASAFGGVMFSTFLLALGHAVAAKIPLPNCGCFGDAIHLTPSQGLMFDSTLLALCVLCWRSGSGPVSLDAWTARGA